MWEYETLRVEVSDGVATITIDRPHARNSMTPVMAREMLDIVQRLSIDRSVRVVVLTGAGSDAFCPGTDTKAFLSGETDPDLELNPLLDGMIFQIPVILYQMPQVTIAAINGATAGAGLSWACACDFRWAARSAKFSTAFLDRGVPADMCLHWTLPRIVGPTVARRLIFFPSKFDADRAQEYGLVDDVFAPEDFRAQVAERVDHLRRAAPLALRATKENLIDAERTDIRTFSDLESHRHLALLASEDCREGFAAYAERRAPNYRGR
ncbi:MAG: enoyl-CoA hydratase-related protein [Actinomycetota bacterium]